MDDTIARVISRSAAALIVGLLVQYSILVAYPAYGGNLHEMQNVGQIWDARGCDIYAPMYGCSPWDDGYGLLAAYAMLVLFMTHVGGLPLVALTIWSLVSWRHALSLRERLGYSLLIVVAASVVVLTFPGAAKFAVWVRD